MRPRLHLGMVRFCPEGQRSLPCRLGCLLIVSGADVKTVKHASAKTTLGTYGHIWPDRDESTRAAVDAVIAARTEQWRNSDEGSSQRRRSGLV